MVHCVRYPKIDGWARAEWIWGENPRRVITVHVEPGEHYPLTALGPDAPSTLLIYTPAAEYGLSESTCVNLSLLRDGEPVTHQNRIVLQSGRNAIDAYVIELAEWPRGTFECRLEQEWHGGILKEYLTDFLEPRVDVLVIPGIRPSWVYCGGALLGSVRDSDSLYGRDDLPDWAATASPFYHYPGTSLPWSILASHQCHGLPEFNEFMSRTFRGTRTVTAAEDVADDWVSVDESGHETTGTQDVVINFETEGEDSDFRFVIPLRPAIMHEQRGDQEILWEVNALDGICALLVGR